MKTKLLLTKLLLMLFISTCLFASNTNDAKTKAVPFMLRYPNVERNQNYNVLQANSQLLNTVRATAADFIANVNAAFLGMPTAQLTASTQVTISPWKKNNGEGIINYNVGFHGNPAAYSLATIPSPSDPNWTAAPVNSNGEINFSVGSILWACLQQLDFTYFETNINIPSNFTITDLRVSFNAADDGARAYIFNSSHPGGAFIGEIRLGQTAITADYSSLAVAGEVNRLVIVQFDDCPSGNNLTGAKVVVNGQVAATNSGGCTQSNFFWSNAPTINGNTASGTINGIGYTYTSSVNVRSTSNMFSHSTFPVSYNVPNANPTIQNIEPSSNTLTFASPMTNPVLVFSSIGGGPISVPINFSAPVEVLWSTHVGSGSSFVQNSPTQITGQEAYAIVRMNGTFTSISFDYLTYENYVNFAFGADFSTNYPDTIAPTITLNGSASVNINPGTTYTDAGTTVADNCDLNPGTLVSGTVNTNVPGNYTLTFTAVDASGNHSAPLTRTVTVNAPPVANAGVDQLFNCAGSRGISVTLNGSGSSDVNGDTLTYTWSENGTTLATGVAPTINTVPGIHTIKLDVTDSKGATSSDTVVITTNGDTTPPTVVTKPITISLNASGAASIIPSDIDGGTTDNCSTVTLSLGAGQGNFSCANVGPNTVTLIATDALGNTASGTAIVTIQDVTPPSSSVAVPPAGLSAVPQLALNNVPESAGFGLLYQLDIPNAAAWTSGVPYAVNNSALTGLNFNRVAYLLELDNKWVWVSMDAFTTDLSKLGLPQQNQAGHNFTLQQNVNNLSVVASTNSGLANRQNIATGNIEIWNYNYGTGNVANVPNASSTSYDWGDQSNGNSTYSSFQVHDHGAQQVLLAYNRWGSGGNSDIGINNNSGNAHKDYTFMQNAANYGVKRLYVFVGNTASSTGGPLSAKDITINLDAQGNATITPQMVDNGSTDACGIASYALDKTHFTCADIATNPNTVTLTVTDTHGNAASATAKVTVVDNLAPSVITKPISVSLDANGVASITTSLVDNGSSDNCSLLLSLDKTTFSCADLGPNTVLLTGTDPSGNSTSTPAIVTVVDNTAPTVITQNITLELDETGIGSIAPSQIDNGSTDNCSLTLTLDKMDFTVANLGANTVILTGTDQSGNVTTAPAIVTIVDVDAPTILTQDVTVFVDASGNASITPQQIDNGSSDPSGPVTLSLDKSNFSCNEVGTPQTVTLTATDSSGNAANATATVTVIDNIAPIISCPADINVFATSAAGAIVTYVAPVGTDNCSANTALTAGLASGSVFPIGTTVVTHTVTDASGNTASCSFNVTVVGIAPVIVCPADITVNNDLGSCGANVSFAATETVGIPSSVITYSIAPGSYFVVGTTAVTATATNAIGSSSCTFNVTVNDTQAPTLITQNISTTLTNGVATITAAQVNNGSTDNCGIASMSVSPSTFVCGDQGTHIVTLTVTDIHGNVSTGTATVTVLGDVPSISVNAFTAVATQATNTIFLGYGPQSMTLSTQTIGGSGFTYQWSSSTGELVASVANPTVSPKLSTIYTVTVTNSNGCQATSTISVCVIDARAIDEHGKYEGKVLVCHKESSGNDDHDEDHSSRNGSHTIEISVNAVEKHLKNHGDTLGACGATCTSSYVDVVVDNDDDDHANNDDDDHADNDKNSKDDKSKSKESEIKAIIYPNPVIDEVGVGLNEKGEGSIEIYDGKGNRIYQKDSKDLKTGVKFSMKGKKTGTYYARVTCKGKVYTATIFKER